jgi:outer membrane immunogenic protein
MYKGLALLAAGSAIALAAPATAQQNPTFTGPRVEALVGYDINKPGSSQDIDNADDLDQSMEGASYGVGIGYDFAAGGALIGIEGEYVGSSAETDYDTAAFETFGVGNVEAGDDLYVGLRAGILASPRALVYVKGGYSNASYNVLTSDGRTNTDTDIDLDGWRVGGGVEYALSNNLFLKGEYRYTNYGEGEVEGPNGGESDRFDIDMDRHQIMAGLGYRF